MARIQQSRLWNNLWRDLHNDYKQDESLSILNTSASDIEITDTHTGVTKIVYPRSILHTNRPIKSIIIMQVVGDKKLKAEVARSVIKKDMILIETPIKFVSSADTYSELLSLNWVNKVFQTGDRLIVTFHNVYYIAVDNSTSSNWMIYMILFLICVCIICVLV